MIGVPGIAERLFRGLGGAGISVTMISQASSEHSICFSVPNEQADKACKCVETAFFAEIQQGLIQSVSVTKSPYLPRPLFPSHSFVGTIGVCGEVKAR